MVLRMKSASMRFAVAAAVLLAACGGSDGDASQTTQRVKNAALPGQITDTCEMSITSPGLNPENSMPILEITMCRPVEFMRLRWSYGDTMGDVAGADPFAALEVTRDMFLNDRQLVLNLPGFNDRRHPRMPELNKQFWLTGLTITDGVFINRDRLEPTAFDFKLKMNSTITGIVIVDAANITTTTPLTTIATTTVPATTTTTTIPATTTTLAWTRCATCVNKSNLVLTSNDFSSATKDTRQNLAGADFRNADLTSTKWRFANLAGANFTGAKLIEANLLDVDLTGAVMTNVDLTGGANKGVNFGRAILDKANLSGAKHTGGGQMNFYSASMKNAKFNGINFAKTIFAGATLDGADFNNANFTAESNFSTASLANVNFTNAKFAKAYFNKTTLTSTNFTNADLRNASFQSANLSSAILTGANLEGADLYKATLPSYFNCAAAKAKCDGVTYASGPTTSSPTTSTSTIAPVTAPNYEKKSLRNANFVGKDLRNANFDGADLTMARFNRADLRGASFVDANLSYAQFQNANLAGADMRGAQMQFALVDNATLPTGFTCTFLGDSSKVVSCKYKN